LTWLFITDMPRRARRTETRRCSSITDDKKADYAFALVLRRTGRLFARRAHQQIRVQPLSQKYSCFVLTQITCISITVPPHRGAYRDRHGRGAGCGGRGGAIDEQRLSGRPNRVVLTPRRWCQVGGSNSADDGGKRARSPGRARSKPLKPLRGESRMIPEYLW
jgi:hypothetical protein